MSSLVSVIIPTYNRADMLIPSVRSVLQQTWQDLECIIVDDGSTDRTKEVLEGLDDPRLRYVYQENAGACAARNMGVSVAKGAFIAFHDSDDTWHPDKLTRQMKALQEHDADIVICKLESRLADGSVVHYPKRIGQGFVSPSDDLFGIGTQTILARRNVLDNNLFDLTLPRYQDLEWLIRALRQYRIYCLDEPLVQYKIEPDSISANPVKMFTALKVISEKYPEIPRKYPALSMHIVKNLLCNRKDFRQAAGGQQKEYMALTAHFYPGAVRYLRARWASGTGTGNSERK